MLAAGPDGGARPSPRSGQNTSMHCCCRSAATISNPDRELCCCGTLSECCMSGMPGFCRTQNCTAILLGAILLSSAVSALGLVGWWVHRARVYQTQAHARHRLYLHMPLSELLLS